MCWSQDTAYYYEHDDSVYYIYMSIVIDCIWLLIWYDLIRYTQLLKKGKTHAMKYVI